MCPRPDAAPLVRRGRLDRIQTAIGTLLDLDSPDRTL
jgi:fatty acid-binding protein DegV